MVPGGVMARAVVCRPVCRPLHTTPIAFLENATVRGRDWYIVLDAPVLTLDVTVGGDRSRHGAHLPDLFRERRMLLPPLFELT